MRASSEVALRPMLESDTPDVLRLLQASLAGGPTGERNEAFFRWKHVHNPFGRSLALVATDGDHVVGVRLFLRWRFLAGAATLRAVRAVDTATDPAYRGLGIFRTLTLAAVEQERGTTDFVFNTPNANSRPGYLSMGWETVGTLPVRVRVARPLRTARFGRGALHDRVGTTSAARPCSLPSARDVLAGVDASDALDDLLEQVSTTDRSSGQIVTDRSGNYLRWRYAGAPGLDYRAVPLIDGGILRALAFGRVRTRGALTELTLGDVLVRDGDVDAALVILRAAARSGADLVTTSLPAGTTGLRAARRAGFVLFPRLGPGLVTNVLRPTNPDPRQLASWRISLGEAEVF